MRYAPRYFDLAEQISAQRGPWATRGVHLAQTALRYLFPALVADEEFIALLDDWLASTDLQDSARRIIAECRDDARRALWVRQANGALTEAVR
jgi:aminopeptidase N